MARVARALFLLALLPACQLSSPGGDQDPRIGATVVPTATGVGVPMGSPEPTIVGIAGGVVSAASGAVKVTVPAGAVATDTTFTVTPISSTAPGALGTTFRIEADPPLTGPVQVTFTGVSAYRGGSGGAALSIRWQDARGFWQPPDAVVQDAGSDTVTATTSHLSDWALILAGTPALEGTFSLVQTFGLPYCGATTCGGDLPFAATGTAALYELAGYGEPTYLVTGSVSLPASLPWGAETCTPTAPTTNLVLGVAEIPTADFRWGIPALWTLDCTGIHPTIELPSLFDTMQINLVHCAGQYVGTQVNGGGYIQGSYTSDCGTDGTVSATWDFRSCTPGGSCVPTNPCLAGTVTCSLGIGTCTPGAPVPADPPIACDAGGTPGTCDGTGVCVP